MSNRQFIHIVPKPHYWKELVSTADDYKIDTNFLLEFLKSVYASAECCMMTYWEFESYDDFQRDEFLSSLTAELVDEYRQENDEEYTEHYEEFLVQVFWADWFGKLLRLINEQIETPRGTARKIKDGRRCLKIYYVEN